MAKLVSFKRCAGTWLHWYVRSFCSFSIALLQAQKIRRVDKVGGSQRADMQIRQDGQLGKVDRIALEHAVRFPKKSKSKRTRYGAPKKATVSLSDGSEAPKLGGEPAQEGS